MWNYGSISIKATVPYDDLVGQHALGERQDGDHAQVWILDRRRDVHTGAFARWVLRDAMFPRSEYAAAWERLSQRLSEREACRLMVDLLDLADRANVVSELAGVLAGLHERDELPDIEALCERFAPRSPAMPAVEVVLPLTAVYDELLEAA